MNRSIPTILAAVFLATLGCDPIEPDDPTNATTGASATASASSTRGNPPPPPVDCDFNCFQPDQAYQYPHDDGPMDRDGNFISVVAVCSKTSTSAPTISVDDPVLYNPVSCTTVENSQDVADLVHSYAVCGVGGFPSLDLDTDEQMVWASWANRHAIDVGKDCEADLIAQGCVAGSYSNGSVGAGNICDAYARWPVFYELMSFAPTHSAQPTETITVQPGFVCDYEPLGPC